MKREDGERLSVEFYKVGLTPYLPALAGRSFGEKKESLMAFRPSLWGLHVWISGSTFVLCDEGGYLTHLEPHEGDLLISLIRFESVEGPGALRCLLSRPIVNPVKVVQVLRPVYNPKTPVPSAPPTKEPRPLRRRKLSPADFSKLLGEI